MKGGILLVDKPVGMGSALLTGIVKRRSHLRVGHTGTLDRFACGLMILVLGPATALADHFLHQDKEYEAEFAFGRSTDTHDPEGQTLDERSGEEAARFVEAQRERIERVITGFRSVTEQVPPVYSALKQGGKRLSDRARRGENVAPRARAVRVDLALVVAMDVAAGRVRARLAVSSGTYIRSFARDLGSALGFPVHLSQLRRTRVGDFSIHDPRVWQVPPRPPMSAEQEAAKGHGAGQFSVQLSPDEALREQPFAMIPLTEALSDWPVVRVGADLSAEIANGKRPLLPKRPVHGDFLICDEQGRLLGWAQAAPESYAWRRVFPQE